MKYPWLKHSINFAVTKNNNTAPQTLNLTSKNWPIFILHLLVKVPSFLMPLPKIHQIKRPLLKKHSVVKTVQKYNTRTHSKTQPTPILSTIYNLWWRPKKNYAAYSNPNQKYITCRRFRLSKKRKSGIVGWAEIKIFLTQLNLK